MTINCTFPPELDDRQLLAYLDGEAGRQIVSHLQGCAYCRQKAEELGHFQKHLISQLYRHTCPPAVELGEYHLRLLPASQMLIVGQHVRECPYCAREIAQLDSFLKDQVSTSKDSLLGQAKLLVARLVSAQELTPASTVLRGEGKGPITFAVEDIIIVLDFQHADTGRIDLSGQVAAEEQSHWTGALVELRKDNQLYISSTVDDLGAFRCEGVTPGQLELRITAKTGSVVVIANFEVPA